MPVCRPKNLLLVFIILIASPCLAQPVMVPSFSNSYRDSPHHYYYYRDPNGIIENTAVEKFSLPYFFTITFKDSTNLSTKAKIDEHKGEFYLAIDNGTMFRSIRPRETLAIERIDENGFRYYGIPLDSCWFFKIPGEDKIKSYSVLAQENTRFVVAIQKGDGPILPLTKENLLAVMQEEETTKKIRELLAKDKLIQAVREYNKL